MTREGLAAADYEDDLVKLLHLGPELVLDALRKKRDSRDDLPSPGRSWPGHVPRRGAGFASFGSCERGPTRGPSSHQQGVQIGGTQGDASSRLPDGMLPAASARLSWDAAGSSFGPSPQLRADNVLKSSSVATAWRCFHQQHCEDDMVMKLRRNLVAVVVMALFCVVHLYLLSFRGAPLSFGSTQRSPSSLSALNMSAEALLGDALWPPKVQDIPRRGQDRRIDVNLASRSIIARSNGDRAPSPALKLRQRLSDVFLKVGISARAAAMQGGRVVALALQDSFGPFPRLNASSVWRRVAWIGVGVFLLDHFLFV